MFSASRSLGRKNCFFLSCLRIICFLVCFIQISSEDVVKSRHYLTVSLVDFNAKGPSNAMSPLRLSWNTGNSQWHVWFCTAVNWRSKFWHEKNRLEINIQAGFDGGGGKVKNSFLNHSEIWVSPTKRQGDRKQIEVWLCTLIRTVNSSFGTLVCGQKQVIFLMEQEVISP